MKVGILSMQQITNYGSFLQAYALKTIISGLGHEVEFINIEPGEQLPQYKISRLHRIKLMWKRLKVKHPYKQLRCTLNLHRRFNKEFKSELGVVPGKSHIHFDVVVIGSDEVFNVAQTTWFGFSTQLFGAGLDTDKVISYAGCFGATTIGILSRLGISNRVAQLLKKFSAISVRDKNSKEVVQELTGTEPFLHVDPVIVYGFDKEICEPPINEEYLLIYTYPGRMNNPEEVESITTYARKNGLKTVAIANYFDWVDEVVTPHPFEVLGYFKKAKCIVTDTFHGAVMSLKFNKPFCVIVREMNSNKLSYLLQQFTLESRIVKSVKHLGNVLDSDIDYDEVNKVIANERNNSINYLKSELSEGL